MNKLVIIFASFCACAALTNARADMASEPRSVAVYFGDLDTSSSQGAAALYGRIKVAAREVCGGLDSDRELWRVPLYKQCMRVAIGRTRLVTASGP